ncbi:MAG TPA: carboxymuconolactone decarboxylase family protein [Hyphomicrobiaceae bacterium]
MQEYGPKTSVTTMPYPDLEMLPAHLREELARRRNRNVFRMLMHSPEAASGFLAMTDAVRSRNALPPALRELAILRVGRRYGSLYEVHHHERIGREVGLAEASIRGASDGPFCEGLAPDEILIIRMTDEVLDRHGLTEPSRKAFLERFDAKQLVDFVLTIGHYQQVCNFLNTFGIAVES